MTAQYGQHAGTRQTPQQQPIPGRTDQVPNAEGGYVFQVDKWKMLDRFLILGCEGGSYYATEREATLENTKASLACLREDGTRAINRVVEISESGRAPKNDPALFVLAIACSLRQIADKSPGTTVDVDGTVRLAYEALPKVARIGTHLFTWAKFVTQFRGWGRGLRDAVGRWYTSKTPDRLALQCAKYQQRDGWAHRDLLRLCHVTTRNPVQNAVLRWVTGGMDQMGPLSIKRKDKAGQEHTTSYGAVTGQLPAIIESFEAAKRAQSAAEVCKLIRENHLPHECVPTSWQSDPAVLTALLEVMPIGATVRSLAKLTAAGVIAPLSEAAKLVCARVTDPQIIKESRLHPMSLLIALKMYSRGKGEKGKLTWDPVAQVADAVNQGFLLSVGNVVPTGLNWCLGLDVSGSMAGTSCAGTAALSCTEAQVAFALVTAMVEKNNVVMKCFDTHIHDCPISPTMRLDTAVDYVRRIGGGGTDCALPMKWATQQKVPVDVFAVWTDSQTWAGSMHPTQAVTE